MVNSVHALLSWLLLPLWLLFHPFLKLRKKKTAPWVIGGHRGRIIADNSRELALEAKRQGIPILWIGNSATMAEARSLGFRTAVRQSWQARLAISQAPCLIYSHGEDDLDLFLILLRLCVQRRIVI